jgi:hypothetical protein
MSRLFEDPIGTIAVSLPRVIGEDHVAAVITFSAAVAFDGPAIAAAIARVTVVRETPLFILIFPLPSNRR